MKTGAKAISRSAIAMTFAVVTALAPMPALASDTPVFGGPGGRRFDSYCNAGTFMVGVAGRTGAWIDAIRPVCARWDEARKAFVDEYDGPNTGGGPALSHCPSQMLVRGWEIGSIIHNNQKTAQRIRLFCQTLLWGSPIVKRPSFSGEAVAEFGKYLCRDGEAAIGIYGFSGAYLDAAGLHCGRSPTHLPLPGAPCPC